MGELKNSGMGGGSERQGDDLESMRSRIAAAVEARQSSNSKVFSEKFNIAELTEGDLLILREAEGPEGLPMEKFNRWRMDVFEEEIRLSGNPELSRLDSGSRTQFHRFITDILEIDNTKKGVVYRVMRGALPK
jgi:hypothetical protein